ncbi:uncharacterized protein FOBCDRAFT_128794 [Fusarium oxysporum Fo47]|uniref:uncharacterized protein n=1 Tax=Fusarium oxysporum Fo47 TaxID=660027 RepID=UPI002869CFDB|nr:uncharacterized protein FOBCDRAFT_128794 [Fusarium oxysporum Fo47]QKD48665.2 hypothetical protein FOBCDRAFT_128794 [Fusarium oxysporum Fo47]
MMPKPAKSSRWVNYAAVSTVSSNPAPQEVTSSLALPAPPPKYETKMTLPLFHQYVNYGLRMFCKGYSQSWIRPFFLDMSTTSPSVPILSAAIQFYIHQGSSVPVLECIDLALKTFRYEVVSYQDTLKAGILSAGVLLSQPCTPYIRMISEVYNLNTQVNFPALQQNVAVRHALELLAVMDIPQLVLGRVCPSLGLWKRFREAQDSWEGGRMTDVEVVSGMPMDLLDIFADAEHDDTENLILRLSLWEWQGDTAECLQHNLWDAWRLAGIVDLRRRDRCRRRLQDRQPDHDADESCGDTSVLDRLMAVVSIIFDCSRLPKHRHILIGLIFPLVVVSLEVRYLKRHAEAKQIVDNVRNTIKAERTYNLAKVVFQLLDDAWNDGSSWYDIDERARSQGVEVALM